jgi:voltage-gated potassium channel Kch
MRRIFSLLVVALGLAAFGCAVAGLLPHEGARLAVDVSPGGWDRFSRVLFGAVAVLGLDEPDPAPTSGWFTTARVFAVLFTVTAASGIVLEFYQPARDGARRLWFWGLRLVGRSPAVVIGLGWVGRRLAAELRAAGRPVYAITLRRAGLGRDEAGESGALIIEGDAMDEAVRRRVGAVEAREVFIATGDDGQNVDIAGRLMESHAASVPGLLAPGARCYVHAEDPAFAGAVRAQGVLPSAPGEEASGRLVFRMFCTSALAARDLFLDLFLDLGRGFQTPGRVGPRPTAGTKAARPPVTCPGPEEAFHLFVLGFGRVGQAVALHTARFAHFASGLRPRLTAFPDDTTGEGPWTAFLDRYPAFAPPGLDLSDPTGQSQWDAPRGHPGAACYRTTQSSEPPSSSASPSNSKSAARSDAAAKALARRRPSAVEYAVDAEQIPTALEADADHLLDDVLARLRATSEPGVRAAIVITFPDERRSVHAALRLQRGLRRRLLKTHPKADEGGPKLTPAPDADALCPLPVYVHLPSEAGLAALLRRRRAEASPGDVEHFFPICSFGERRDVATYGAITQGAIRAEALGLDALHRLTAENAQPHPDFDASNIDAVVHAEVKWAALGITFHRRPLPAGATPLLEGLFAEEVDAAFSAIYAAHPPGELPPAKRLSAPVADRLAALSPKATQILQERCALELGRLLKADSIGTVLIEQDGAGWDRDAFNVIIDRVIGRFEEELKGAGVTADVAAEMEHNRWMGERLMKGWRYGLKDNGREQRPTFLPWDLLTNDERRYDRQQLPRLIVARRREGLIACVHSRSKTQRTDTTRFQRRDRRVI